MTAATIVSIAGVVIGGLLGGGLIGYILLHKRESPKASAEAAKTRAETAEILSNTAITLAQSLEKRIVSLEEDSKVTLEHIGVLEKWIEDGKPPPPPTRPERIRNR